MTDKNLIFEKGGHSVSSFRFKLDKKEDDILGYIPAGLRRKDLKAFPDVSENTVVRHFIRLSNMNYGLDTGFYPLGSCTMKYNPKINELISKKSGFNLHPYSSTDHIQGNLEILHDCKKELLDITGMDDMTLSPCAGAHGELLGMFLIAAYFGNKKEKRPIVLVPDSAHGTNPASANVAGFKVVSVKSDKDGFVDIQDLKSKASKEVAALMLTNPNTLGLYEKHLEEIVNICHGLDIQLYYDGANLNAILGIVKPGDTGFDVVHLNLHKSFSTPHGGGGPGAGVVGVKKHLAGFLPGEDFVRENGRFLMKKRGGNSIGKIRSFNSNFLIVIRAFVYIKSMGKNGLRHAGLMALLNANYLASLLKKGFEIATKDHVMHEFVISLTEVCKASGITIVDFAKRILDYGYHSPTMSFPLIIHDCLMIEPTETESRENLERFAEAMYNILKEARENPELLRNAPVNTPIRRVDDVQAARNPILKYY
jgi:glycine dehydrogenase subunit 2